MSWALAVKLLPGKCHRATLIGELNIGSGNGLVLSGRSHYISHYCPRSMSSYWLVRERRRNSSALAMELRLSWTNPSLERRKHKSSALAMELRLSCTNPLNYGITRPQWVKVKSYKVLYKMKLTIIHRMQLVKFMMGQNLPPKIIVTFLE